MLEITNDNINQVDYLEEEQTNEVAELYYDKEKVWPYTPPPPRTTFTLTTDKPTAIHIDIDHPYERSIDGKPWEKGSGVDTIAFEKTLGLRAFCITDRCGIYMNQTLDRYGDLSTDAKISMSGPLTALVNCEKPDYQPTTTVFYFSYFKDLVDASGLIFPDVIWSDGQYHEMFRGCENLKYPPALPARVLTERCYQRMFKGCTSLTYAPELPALSLTRYCYNSMFADSGLVRTGYMGAMDASDRSCEDMFEGCKSLVSAEIPLIHLAPYCVYDIFSRCSNLTLIRIHFVIQQSDWTRYCGNIFAGLPLSGVTLVKPAPLNPPTSEFGTGVPSGWNIVNG